MKQEFIWNWVTFSNFIVFSLEIAVGQCLKSDAKLCHNSVKDEGSHLKYLLTIKVATIGPKMIQDNPVVSIQHL